jgi:hypothetical protein
MEVMIAYKWELMFNNLTSMDTYTLAGDVSNFKFTTMLAHG